LICRVEDMCSCIVYLVHEEPQAQATGELVPACSDVLTMVCIHWFRALKK